MNSSTMLLMMMAMGSSSSSGSSSSGVMETILYTSNMMPETMRMLLAMNSVQARNDKVTREAEELANRLASQAGQALKIVVQANGRKLTPAELAKYPDLKSLLERLPSAEFAAIVGDTTA